MGHPDLARRALLDRVEGWGADLEPVLAALLAHHGRPITADPVPPDAWSRSPTYDPMAELTPFPPARGDRPWFHGLLDWPQ